VIWLALLLAQAASAQPVSRGEKIFAQSCSVGYCHGVAGAAGRGPRLRGRTFERNYLYRVIREGIPSSAMPGWKDRLKSDEIDAVVEYVASLGKIVEEPASPGTPAATASSPAPVAIPPQAGRGHELFFDATRETHCGTCHAVGGRGIAVGPELSPMAAKAPREFAAKLRSRRSQHVLWVRLKNGETFPALRASQDERSVRLYDLTTPPPVLRSFEPGEIQSLTPYPDWRHDTYAQNLNAEGIADLVAYLRWAASGDKLEVPAAQVE